TYVWSITGGNATISNNGNNSVTVNFGPAFTSGTLCVHGQTACGYNGPDRCINISVNTGQPGIISGPTLVCGNAQYSYSIPALVPGATNYGWSVNGGPQVFTTTTTAIVTMP